MLLNTLHRGFSKIGWRFAVEADRAPVVSGEPIASAAERLPKPNPGIPGGRQHEVIASFFGVR